MYCYVWEYLVRPDKRADFRKTYGLEGEWVELFRQDPGYVRTLLLEDRDDSQRFMTVDFWISREASVAFREAFHDAFQALDERCEALTLRETQLGEFQIAE